MKNELLFKNPTAWKCSDNRVIKQKLIDDYNYSEKCAICNLENKWQGKKLVLQLDHINGDNKDNRIENLRLLCPNCHSQTSTFCKNKNLKYKPNLELLLKENETMTHRQMGEKYNVHHRTIQRWLNNEVRS